MDCGLVDGEAAAAADAQIRVQARAAIGCYIDGELRGAIGGIARIRAFVVVIVPPSHSSSPRNTPGFAATASTPRAGCKRDSARLSAATVCGGGGNMGDESSVTRVRPG